MAGLPCSTAPETQQVQNAEITDVWKCRSPAEAQERFHTQPSHHMHNAHADLVTQQPCAAPAAQQVQNAADVSKLQVSRIRHQLQPTAGNSNTPKAAPVACRIGGTIAWPNAPSTCKNCSTSRCCRGQAFELGPKFGT